MHLASTVSLGGIALQGVRRCNPTLGETVVVIGLGALGQITAQLLLANGCRVIGVDLDAHRVACAVESGIHEGIHPNGDNIVERIQLLTEGLGADAAIITASSSSDQVVNQAMNACRKKGRVVVVGSIGLNLNRRDFYSKELDLFISCSYGPGRYDPVYEEEGNDYPLPYVRWTENRNMEAYLALLASGRLRFERFPTETYDIEKAETGYQALAGPGNKPLLVFLQYKKREGVFTRKTMLRIGRSDGNRIGVAVVGAGEFAQGMHLPNLVRLRAEYELRAVMTRSGPKALNTARRFGAAYGSTDFEQVLSDESVELILICTRHHLHAPMVLQALRAGKHVLVEKPLCLKRDELQQIRDFYNGNGSPQVLLTGFNRRFSPAIRLVRQWLQKRSSPLLVDYRMNAGLISTEHWVHSKEGGGRNIGEACHIYDLFNCLTGSEVQSIHVSHIRSSSKTWSHNDNFVATVSYEDGSLCTLTYTALGSKSFPKERMEAFADGTVISLDDFKSVEITGAKMPRCHSRTPEKGQLQELQALAQCLRSGGEWPISLDEQIAATEISFAVEEQLRC
jgi:predicted dehydrogenase